MIQGKLTEKAYRKISRDSSSSLKEFATNRKKYYKKYVLNERVEDDEQESKASITGKLVETLLLEPHLFDEKFYMSSVTSAPTGNMLLFVESLLKSYLSNSCEFEECLKIAYKDSGYKWAFEKVLEKFSGSDAEIYFNEAKEVRAKNLTVVTVDDISNADRVVAELKTNEFIAPIIGLIGKNNDRYEILIQQSVNNYEIDGLELKSLLDIIIIDHKDKVIYPYDLKCTFSVEGFYSEYYLYRKAYIQAYLYKEACNQLKIDRGLDYYRVENLQFIVCDSINYMAPLIYQLSNDDMDDAYNGFEANGRKYVGVKNIISDLKWAQENSTWNISKKNFENGGISNIKG